MENNELARYDFVEENTSKEARRDFYDGIKHLEKGNYFEAGIAFSNYKTDNFEFDAEVPSYFHRQVVEGHIENSLKSLDENDFYTTGFELDIVENYLKMDAEELERKDTYLKNVGKLQKTLVNKVFSEMDNSISKNEIWEAEQNLDFLESYLNYEGKSFRENYLTNLDEYKTKIKNKEFENYIEEELEFAQKDAERELKWKKVDDESDPLKKEYEKDEKEIERNQKELEFLINNFDKFYELAYFEDESPVIGLESLKNYDRKINQKEGEYLINHKGNNKVDFGKDSLESRLN